MKKRGTSQSTPEELLRLRDAALQLGISFPTIKQWIYKKKLRSVQTAGGHHRIPQSEVDRLLFKTRDRKIDEQRQHIRSVSGRNQLVGRIVSVRISGLMRGWDLYWRTTDHIDYHVALGARDATETWTDSRSPHQSC